MEATHGSILLVRHGVGRGRANAHRYLEWILDDVKRLAPATFGRIRFHYTGSPRPSLDGCRAVVFWLGDPLRELYPECFEEAVALEVDARERGLDVVNAPDALSNTIKSRQSALWRAAGIDAPRHTPYATRGEFEAALPRIEWPAIVRSDTLHSGAYAWRVNSAQEVSELTELAVPGTFVEWRDTRAPWRDRQPDSIWARFFHKKRVCVLDDSVHPVHCVFSERPLVSLGRSTMFTRARPWRYPGAFLRALGRHREAVSLDREFDAAPMPHADLMVRAVKALGLRFAAIDYADLPDGTAVLWEANPHFDWTPWQRGILPRGRELRRRHETLCGHFARWLDRLASQPGRVG